MLQFITTTFILLILITSYAFGSGSGIFEYTSIEFYELCLQLVYARICEYDGAASVNVTLAGGKTFPNCMVRINVNLSCVMNGAGIETSSLWQCDTFTDGHFQYSKYIS